MRKALALFAAVVGCSETHGLSLITDPSVADAAVPDPGCSLPQAAFCDTFDRASPGGNAGDLDDAEWSVARSGVFDVGQGRYDEWVATTRLACGATTPGVLPPDDFFFCAGGESSSMHLSNAFDDNDGFVFQSMRIRRPFDFANRTGVIAFDVDGQGQLPGGHGYWFNVFISDEPVPAPCQGTGSAQPFVRAGVAIEFNAGGQGLCPGRFQGGDGTVNTVSSFVIEKDYQIAYQTRGSPKRPPTCFLTRPEVLNHIEIHISARGIEVFASDAGMPASTMRRVASVDDTVLPDLFPLPLTRGYVHFQHLQYHASKFTFTDDNCTQVCCEHDLIDDPGCRCDPSAPSDVGPCVDSVPHCPAVCPTLPSHHTYHWDNIAFDGPVFATPRAYEVPLPGNGGTTGYLLSSGGMVHQVGQSSPDVVTLPGVDLAGATGARLTLDAYGFVSGEAIQYCFNGCSHHTAWRTFGHPFPDSTDAARAVSIPVSLSDLQTGDNLLEMRGSGSVGIADAELTVDLD
jgi:hypothetical protein